MYLAIGGKIFIMKCQKNVLHFKDDLMQRLVHHIQWCFLLW